MAQENEKGKEKALYYLSRTLNGAELNYSPIEKMCLALFFTIDKLEHYMQAYRVCLDRTYFAETENLLLKSL